MRIIIAAVAIIGVVIIVAVVTKGKKESAESDEAHKTAFENPMYSDAGAHGANAQNSYEGMSDGDGYMDMQ